MRRTEDPGPRIVLVIGVLLGVPPACAPTDLCTYSVETDQGGRLPDHAHKTMQVDDDCDGTPEHCASFSRNADGAIVSAWDEACDGTLDVCNTFTEDDHGNTLRVEQDEGCDGSVDAFWGWQYTYRESGDELTEEVVSTDDPTDRRCHSTFHYANGNLRAAQEDVNCDGEADNCDWYSYDTHGGVRTDQFDPGCDCRYAISTCYFSTYDAEGNQLKRDIDDDCDGQPNRCESYSY